MQVVKTSCNDTSHHTTPHHIFNAHRNDFCSVPCSLNLFLFNHPRSETLINPNFVLDSTTLALKSIFIQVISFFTNPILNGIITFLFLLSLLWSLMLLNILLRLLLSNFFFSYQNSLCYTPKLVYQHLSMIHCFAVLC